MTARAPRPVVAGLAGLAVALSGLAVVSTTAPAQANPDGTGLVIKEVYGAGGNAGAVYNADFVELYNPTPAPISVNGLSIHYRSAAGGQGGSPLPLSGSVPPNGHFLIQMSATGATGAALPAPDFTATPAFSMAAAGGQVFLLNGTTNPFPNNSNGNAAGNAAIVDMVGANGALTFETADTVASASATQSLNRSGTGADSDNNETDFALAPPSPTNSEVAGEELTATDPADVTAFVGTAISPITLDATGGTPTYSWDISGLPAGLSETSDGVIGGTPTTAGTSTVTATVTDSATPTPATDSVQFDITVSEPEEVTIAEIQGTGDASEMVGDAVLTEGVVTAEYPIGGYNGIYIQTAGSGGSTDATPGASDAIFVFGSSSMPDGVEIGDSVEVTGVVSEFFGTTEITPSAGGVVEVTSPGEVAPRDTIPGTDCALPGDACLTGTALNAAREAYEGEVFQPTGHYTVTDVHDGSAFNGTSFSSNFFGEVGLAAESEMPLVTPTEVIDAQATAAVAARKAYNDAHRMVLDDGAGVTYWNPTNTGQMNLPFPWFTETNQVRVGASVSFPKPVVLEWRNNTWKIQPQNQVTDDGADRVSFEQDRPAQPEDVGGELKLGTFNVLNYFTTLGEDVAGCTPFTDRLGNPIAVNRCRDNQTPPQDLPNGPRGAWNEENFLRQQAKIVNSINTMDADIIALEEIENSGIVDGTDRDEAVATLVEALNTDAGSTRWAYVHSPAAIDPGEDVIRTALIYNPDTVDLVGGSELFYDEAFSDAREPFAQTFKAAGADAADGFVVIANHFKSKGSGNPDPDGQGNANDRRMLQATALAGFADDFAATNGVEKIFLTGDFNAYSQEDPVQILHDAGYTSLESTDDPAEESYNFDGMIGSLDHVFANEAALPDVTGVDIWTINGYESQYYEYSRFNYNIRQLYDPAPFRASDHNPELVGIAVDDRATPTILAEHLPQKVKVNKTRAVLGVVVFAKGERPTGTITVTLPDGRTLEAELWHGLTAVLLPKFGTIGEHRLTIEYSGDDRVAPGTIEHTVRVVR